MNRKSFLSILALSSLLIACKKDTDQPQANIPSALIGKWKRGVFPVAEFAGYTGDTIMHGSNTTDAIFFESSGRARFYTMFFPTNPNSGCTPQKFMELDGNIAVDTAQRSITFTPSSGQYRELYQSCPGRINVNRAMTSTELHDKKITYYYRTEVLSGDTYLRLSYTPSQEVGIYLEKTNW